MANINKMLPVVPREKLVMSDGSVSPRWMLYFQNLQRILGTENGLDASIVDVTAQTQGTVADRRHSQLTGVYIADDTNSGIISEDASHARHVTDEQAARWSAQEDGDDQALIWLF